MTRRAATTQDLVEQLVAIRVDRGLTQQRVADTMHVTRPTVSYFELGTRGEPLISTVLRYASAVGAHLAVVAGPAAAEVSSS